MVEKVSLSHLDAEEKARRAATFGSIAEDYERFRPGPDPDAVDWLLPQGATTVIDLGAGTGGLTRQLVGRIPRVIAVEPDDRMRAVLEEALPDAEAVRGKGEEMPLPDGCSDAVLASASWHWMEPAAALREVKRVLAPGGVLGVMWAGPDRDGAFLKKARTMMGGSDAGLTVLGDADRPESILEIPEGIPFAEPEHRSFERTVPLTADGLIGLLGTFSWMILLEEAERQAVFDVARQLLRDELGVKGDVTVDVEFRTEAWRTTPFA